MKTTNRGKAIAAGTCFAVLATLALSVAGPAAEKNQAGYIPYIGHAAQGVYAAYAHARQIDQRSSSATLQVRRVRYIGHAAQGSYAAHARAQLRKRADAVSAPVVARVGRVPRMGHAAQGVYAAHAHAKLLKQFNERGPETGG